MIETEEMDGIRLIASDLDGTLLDENKQLPPDFFSVIRRLDNVKFIAASGRQYFNLLKFFAPIQDRIGLIAENGALLWDGGRIIHTHPLSGQDALFMLRQAKKAPNAYCILCGEKSAYIENGPEHMMRGAIRSYDRCRVVERMEDQIEKDRILKIAVHSIENQAEFDAYPALNHLVGNFKVILSGSASVDVMAKGVHKGEGLKIFRERLGLGKKQCMAFGDYLNDFELLAEAEESYAMENAHPRLKEAAKYIAPSNQSDGVMQIIRRRFRDSINQSI